MSLAVASIVTLLASIQLEHPHQPLQIYAWSAHRAEQEDASKPETICL
jgi:hypothetical protein